MCDSLKAENISITEPLELQTYITNFKHVTCNNGGDGEATLGIEGGTQPYIINWITGQKLNMFKAYLQVIILLTLPIITVVLRVLL